MKCYWARRASEVVNCSVCVCGKIFEIFMLLLVVMFWFLTIERVSGDEAAFVVGLLQRQSDCNKIIKNNKGRAKVMNWPLMVMLFFQKNKNKNKKVNYNMAQK